MKLVIRALFSLILPFTAAVLFHFFIFRYNNHLLSFNSFLSGFMLIAGIILIILGFLLVLYTNKSFFKIGKVTLAPWDPPRKLVIAGLYRYVRNPMIIAVLIIILGESFIFASIELFLWYLTFFIINHIYIVYFEEPELIKRFGSDYVDYKENVPQVDS